jgi:hypothetical protein
MMFLLELMCGSDTEYLCGDLFDIISLKTLQHVLLFINQSLIEIFIGRRSNK